MTPSALAHHVDHWVFDLDNTLYPATNNLFAQIDQQMTAYVQRHLQMEESAARALQKRYYLEHGATLVGMMAQHGIDPHHFLEAVHDVDYTAIEPDAALAALISALPGKKLVFTNGSRGHAHRAIDRLGIAHCFADIHAIEDGAFTPKPAPLAFQRLHARHAFEAGCAILFDDLPRNIGAAKAFGMRTALVRSGQNWDSEPQGAQPASSQNHPPEADFAIDGLHDFLIQIAAGVPSHA